MYRYQISNEGTERFTVFGQSRYLDADTARSEAELERERLGLPKARVMVFEENWALPDDDMSP